LDLAGVVVSGEDLLSDASPWSCVFGFSCHGWECSRAGKQTVECACAPPFRGGAWRRIRTLRLGLTAPDAPEVRLCLVRRIFVASFGAFVAVGFGCACAVVVKSWRILGWGCA
jgi:hypothetical protein